MKLFDRRSAEDKFWDWFLKNQSQIREIKDGSEPIVGDLPLRLSEVKDGLMWEKGQLPDGRDHFIVSADGRPELYAAVKSLVAAAPQLTNWEITAFRPRKEMSDVRYKDVSLRLDDLAFFPVASDPRGPLNLTVMIPGLASNDRNSLIVAMFVLLDSLIGEETAITKLGTMEFIPLEEGDGSERPLRELAELLETRGER